MERETENKKENDKRVNFVQHLINTGRGIEIAKIVMAQNTDGSFMPLSKELEDEMNKFLVMESLSTLTQLTDFTNNLTKNNLIKVQDLDLKKKKNIQELIHHVLIFENNGYIEGAESALREGLQKLNLNLKEVPKDLISKLPARLSKLKTLQQTTFCDLNSNDLEKEENLKLNRNLIFNAWENNKYNEINEILKSVNEVESKRFVF